jgi:aldehyde:ferredoxin oxidoreductase
MEITGKASEDVIIFIDGDTGTVSIETAPLEEINSHLLGAHLTRMYAQDEKGQRGVSVMSTGDAAEHIRYAIINSTYYDVRRKEIKLKQAGRGGTGRVFRDKKIKGIVVRFSNMRGDSNGSFDKKLIRKAGKRFNREMNELDDKQNQMKKGGTAKLGVIMDHFDLPPTHNFKFGSHAETSKIDSGVWMSKFTQGLPDGCWLGCTMSCSHGVDGHPLQTGPYAGQKVLVDGPEYENAAGLGSNIGNFDPEIVLELNFYCDTYGVDTISFANCVAFAMESYEACQS